MIHNGARSLYRTQEIHKVCLGASVSGAQSAALQAPPSMGFSTQEYWSESLCPPPRDLSDTESKPTSPALAGRCFTTEPSGKPPRNEHQPLKIHAWPKLDQSTSLRKFWAKTCKTGNWTGKLSGQLTWKICLRMPYLNLHTVQKTQQSPRKLRARRKPTGRGGRAAAAGEKQRGAPFSTAPWCFHPGCHVILLCLFLLDPQVALYLTASFSCWSSVSFKDFSVILN